MPYRFFRRKTIMPGVRLNLSRSGPSLSFGVRGAHYTVGHGRRRVTAGIPGTGLFYTQYSHQHARAPGRRRTVAAATAAPPRGPGITELFHKSPRAKIGYGILLTLLVITSPIGVPLLLTGIVQLFASRRWRARRLVARAHAAQSPDASKVLLDAAAAAAPSDPEVLAAQAGWHVGQSDWHAAAGLYEQYLALAPADPVARGQYARALLMDGRPDEAITQLLAVRALGVDDESEASITSLMALAWLMKGDASQALAIVREAPLQRHLLGHGLQQCLRFRAIAQYMGGHTARGVADLERLYAVNPAYPDVVADREAMQAGTFFLETPLGVITPSSIAAGAGHSSSPPAVLPPSPEVPPPSPEVLPPSPEVLPPSPEVPPPWPPGARPP